MEIKYPKTSSRKLFCFDAPATFSNIFAAPSVMASGHVYNPEDGQ